MDCIELGQRCADANAARKADAQSAQIAMPDLLSGEATWFALKDGIEEFTRVAPKDHDVFILVRDVRVLEARFVYPHSFSFEGLDSDGHHTRIIIHFSQLEARIVYHPKRGKRRVITGFSNEQSS